MIKTIVTIVGKVQARVICMLAYGVICALELRGLALVAAGQSALTLPLSMKIALFAVFLWSCWQIVWAVYKTEYQKTEYALDGIVLLIVTSIIGICFTVVQVAYLIMQMYAGHGILEKPDYPDMALYAFLALSLGGGSLMALRIKKNCPSARIGAADCIAALGFSLLFAAKLGMRFVTGNSAIMLKGVGCVAVMVGLAALAVSVLQAMRRKEPEASANRKPLLDAMLCPPSDQRP
jgi:hypothetical protein